MTMGKVLVVDDEPSVRDIVKTYLEYANLTVSTASDGLDALEKIRRENFDVVISDIQMPNMDGLTLAGEVHQVQPDTVVILMTGYASVNTAVEAIKRDVFDYILKPFQNMQILQQTVRRGIERKRLIQEHRTLTDDLKRTNNELDLHRRLLQKEIAALDTELSRRVDRLTTLFNISRSATSITNLSELMHTIMDNIVNALPGSLGILWLVDTHRENLTLMVAAGINEATVIPERMGIDEGDIGETVRSNLTRVFSSLDELSDPVIRSICEQEKAHSLIMVPLGFEDEVLGAFCIMFRDSYRISDDDVSLLKSIADQSTISIKNAELYQQQQRLFRETIEALATAIDSRDHYTGGHSYMVTQYALLIANRLGFDEKRLELIRVAGLLHDVGKIGISDTILNKPGRLTEEEMGVIKSHPILGRLILESIDALKPAAKIIYHHHERYDGAGYPEGIKGENIPLESRILQCADIFHALTSDRIYRKAMPLDAALDIIRKEQGTTFDPTIGSLFLDLSNEDEFKALLTMS
jgi:putative nucleotidyltransferase with HDIG domain